MKGEADTANRDDVTQKKINAATDQLVQFNSTLAYALSQCFGGVSPIIENRSLIHTHSLLGIGAAVASLDSYVSCCDAAFHANSVYEAVRYEFSDARFLNVYRSLEEVDELREWNGQPALTDRLVAKVSERDRTPPRPHVAYFSGRLGFGETPFSISAAVQCLPAADTVRWSLMTLSHELMHAHVRELLYAIWAPYGDDKSHEASFHRTYKMYKEFLRGRPLGDNQYTNLVTSVRFALLNYCRFRRSVALLYGDDNETVGEQEVLMGADRMPSVEEMRKALRKYYRDLNEIIVHTLDFKYFYDANAELYIDLLWLSWATVPSVLADPKHYILRTLAAVSTTFDGTLTHRFENACALLNQRISGLRDRCPNTVLVDRMSAHLAEERNRGTFLDMCLPNQYLAEFTRHCLFASSISDRLVDDELLDVNEEDMACYLLQVGEFPGDGVQSPVALLADRMRRILANPQLYPESTLNYRSAWLFLACSAIEPEAKDVSWAT